MSVRKQHPACSKTVKIWRLGLRVTAEAANPIIQVVYRDEQDVRLAFAETSRTSSRDANE